MVYVPFIGRLRPSEYIALAGSFILVFLESIIRILTLALPNSLIQFFYTASRRLFNRFTSPAQKKAQERRSSISTSIRNASDFVDLCALWGYTAEEHIVPTKDGYLLGIHRLAWRKGEEDMKVNNGPNSIRKRVVYLHHGLLMNSEVWVCQTDAERCLAFALVERGFDVWLGNNRGNKYSKKSIKTSPANFDFWNFSIDEFAFHDIPDTIDYILSTTEQPSLSYVGFSQGTAQAFATLAVHPKLNDKVNVFVALAPAMSPAGLHNGIVDALTKASPQVLYLLFGRRSILASATLWQSILYPPIFVRVIDFGLSFLFNWQTKNLSAHQKLAAYPHLYSFTSTKSVVHWFQIMANKCFQMYDDDVQTPLTLSTSSKYTKVARYPTRNIKTPIVLVYGGSDSLVDIKVMLRELPSRTVATEIPHYEHLDFLWARDVHTQVFQHVFDALDSFTTPQCTKEMFDSYRRARAVSLGASASFRKQAHHQHHPSDVVESDAASIFSNPQDSGFESSSALPHQAREDIASPVSVSMSTPPPEALQSAAARRVSDLPSSNLSTLAEPTPETADPPIAAESGEPISEPTSAGEQATPSPDRRESWGGVDGASESQRPKTPTPDQAGRGKDPKRRGSVASLLSFDSPKSRRGKGGGIRVGTAKPVGGLVTRTSMGSLTGAESDGNKNQGV